MRHSFFLQGVGGHHRGGHLSQNGGLRWSMFNSAANNQRRRISGSDLKDRPRREPLKIQARRCFLLAVAIRLAAVRGVGLEDGGSRAVRGTGLWDCSLPARGSPLSPQALRSAAEAAPDSGRNLIKEAALRREPPRRRNEDGTDTCCRRGLPSRLVPRLFSRVYTLVARGALSLP